MMVFMAMMMIMLMTADNDDDNGDVYDYGDDYNDDMIMIYDIH